MPFVPIFPPWCIWNKHRLILIESLINWFKFGDFFFFFDAPNLIFGHNSRICILTVKAIYMNIYQDKMIKWWHFLSRRSKLNFTLTVSCCAETLLWALITTIIHLTADTFRLWAVNWIFFSVCLCFYSCDQTSGVLQSGLQGRGAGADLWPATSPPAVLRQLSQGEMIYTEQVYLFVPSSNKIQTD